MLVCGCLWVCVYVLSLYRQDLALYQHFNYYYYVHTLYKRQRGNYIKKNQCHCFSAVSAFQTRQLFAFQTSSNHIKSFPFYFHYPET